MLYIDTYIYICICRERDTYIDTYIDTYTYIYKLNPTPSIFQDRLVESPRWLASRSDAEALQAQAILAHLRGEAVGSLAVIQV